MTDHDRALLVAYGWWLREEPGVQIADAHTPAGMADRFLASRARPEAPPVLLHTVTANTADVPINCPHGRQPGDCWTCDGQPTLGLIAGTWKCDRCGALVEGAAPSHRCPPEPLITVTGRQGSGGVGPLTDPSPGVWSGEGGGK